MAGTLKLCVPELPCDGELVGCEDFVAVAEGLAVAECVAVAEAFGVAECRGLADRDDVGPVGSPDGEGDSDGSDRAAAEPPEDAEVEATPGLDPVAAQAVRPAPAATMATITAGIRRILMFLLSCECPQFYKT
jgi:hypothetical protein